MKGKFSIIFFLLKDKDRAHDISTHDLDHQELGVMSSKYLYPICK